MNIVQAEVTTAPVDAAASRLLIVDDSELMRDLVQRMLRAEGYTITVAGNGREAQKRLAAGGFDLVITDLFMPDMDGIELVRDVAARLPGTPVIVLTGADRNRSASLLSAARVFGAVAALQQPISGHDLRYAVRSALTGKPTDAPPSV